MAHKTVIVESPAKARAIQSYLGKQYKVVASMGHVRSLPSKPGSIMIEKDFAAIYEDNSQKQVQNLVNQAKGSESIYLATDPDREGEAISFHVAEVLKDNGVIVEGKTPISRVVFTSITKATVMEAIKHPRDINLDLVRAQQARQSLDYLFGFTLSPLLWYKLPNTKSAGRVQSVALRLICEREDQISDFKSEEFWNIKATFLHPDGGFIALLTHLQGKRVDKFYCRTQKESESLVADLEKRNFSVDKVQTKQIKRQPKPPFITSTLQQEASVKLHCSAKRTMSIAQKLYEGIKVGNEIVGLITYMRTDGVYIDEGAMKQLRGCIKKRYGEDYLASKQRVYKSKVRNAQEAHEAIRPTNFDLDPATATPYLSEDQLKIYTLVWNRALASQMSDAIIDQKTITVKAEDGYAGFSASSSHVSFEGFYKVDPHEAKETKLPEAAEGEKLDLQELKPEQSFTQPPPRYTEASLVKQMEELGIGRPSTYASIISVIQDRGYGRLENRSFIPEKIGQILNLFLKTFFERYVEYDFTANLEEELDSVALGKMGYAEMLEHFWKPFFEKVSAIKDVNRVQILELLEDKLKRYVLPKDEQGNFQESCPSCSVGRLKVNVGRFGIFIRCSRHPECEYTGNPDAKAVNPAQPMGIHPDTGEEIQIKVGPYGRYLQMGEKRTSIPKNKEFENLTLEKAVSMLKLPKLIGTAPDNGGEVIIGIGGYGPYIKYQGKYTSVKSLDALFELDLEGALQLIQLQEQKKASGNSQIKKKSSSSSSTSSRSKKKKSV